MCLKFADNIKGNLSKLKVSSSKIHWNKKRDSSGERICHLFFKQQSGKILQQIWGRSCKRPARGIPKFGSKWEGEKKLREKVMNELLLAPGCLQLLMVILQHLSCYKVIKINSLTTLSEVIFSALKVENIKKGQKLHPSWKLTWSIFLVTQSKTL